MNHILPGITKRQILDEWEKECIIRRDDMRTLMNIKYNDVRNFILMLPYNPLITPPVWLQVMDYEFMPKPRKKRKTPEELAQAKKNATKRWIEKNREYYRKSRREYYARRKAQGLL